MSCIAPGKKQPKLRCSWIGEKPRYRTLAFTLALQGRNAKRPFSDRTWKWPECKFPVVRLEKKRNVHTIVNDLCYPWNGNPFRSMRRCFVQEQGNWNCSLLHSSFNSSFLFPFLLFFLPLYTWICFLEIFLPTLVWDIRILCSFAISTFLCRHPSLPYLLKVHFELNVS